MSLAPDSTTPYLFNQAVVNKIFVSRLDSSHTEEDIKKLFAKYGEVERVVVDVVAQSAVVSFKEERVVNELENMGEIMLNSTKLFIARVLEEHPQVHVDIDEDAPFYQAGVQVTPADYPLTDQGLTGHSNPYPYQSYYPWPYPVNQVQASPCCEQLVADTGNGPAQSKSTGLDESRSSIPHLLPDRAYAGQQSVFSFEGLATKLPPQQRPPSSLPTGACHVCTSASPVQGVHHIPSQYPYQYPYSGECGIGNKLQPLTPITPNLQTGYLLPQTPTPTNLSPMTPTFFVPPSPAPSNMLYDSYNFSGYTSPPETPHSNSFTHLKDDSGKGQDQGLRQEESKAYMQNMTYFTSPFKKFTKFHGTPTPGGFPLRHAWSGNRGRWAAGESTSSWYQQGDRWGHRSGGEDQLQGEEKDIPDVVKDC